MLEREEHIIVWKRIIKGDENALSELYKQHYLGLNNYGRTIVEDRDVVNDCFMQMLVEFWDKRSLLPEVDNVRSYLMTSLRRAILAKLEAEKRRELKHVELKDFSDLFQRSYEEQLVKFQTDTNLKAKIKGALNKLTDRQKELIRLKFYDNLSYDEIAEQAGVTKRTAYNIIYDGIKMLREELSEDQNSSFTSSLPIIFILLFDYAGF